MEGVTTRLNNHLGKGKRLIVLHIGSEDGFVENERLLFKSKKSRDYHEEMNGEMFTDWMKNILPVLEPNSVIAMHRVILIKVKGCLLVHGRNMH